MSEGVFSIPERSLNPRAFSTPNPPPFSFGIFRKSSSYFPSKPASFSAIILLPITPPSSPNNQPFHFTIPQPFHPIIHLATSICLQQNPTSLPLKFPTPLTTNFPKLHPATHQNPTSSEHQAFSPHPHHKLNPPQQTPATFPV